MLLHPTTIAGATSAEVCTKSLFYEIDPLEQVEGEGTPCDIYSTIFPFLQLDTAEYACDQRKIAGTVEAQCSCCHYTALSREALVAPSGAWKMVSFELRETSDEVPPLPHRFIGYFCMTSETLSQVIYAKIGLDGIKFSVMSELRNTRVQDTQLGLSKLCLLFKCLSTVDPCVWPICSEHGSRSVPCGRLESHQYLSMRPVSLDHQENQAKPAATTGPWLKWSHLVRDTSCFCRCMRISANCKTELGGFSGAGSESFLRP